MVTYWSGDYVMTTRATFIFAVTLANVGRFLKILSMSESEKNGSLQEWKISHRSLTLLLHYLVKLTLVWLFKASPAHRARETVEVLGRETGDLISPDLWPPNSPYLNWLRDLGCHAASCISEENPHHWRTEAQADWSLVRPWTVDCRHGYWSVAPKT